MSSLFQQLEIEAFRAGVTPRTKESIAWFRRKATQLGRISRSQVLRDEQIALKNRPRTGAFGNMYLYYYDAKFKDTLPYYDAFPLVIPLGPAKGGFYGMNLHYLPPVLRAKFLDALLDTTNNKKYDESTRFNLTYNLLKGAARYRYFKPCIKHYLLEHVKSRFAEVASPEWEIATFLPIARWKKESANRVYSESRRIANG